jgi:group I intron endonuclease
MIIYKATNKITGKVYVGQTVLTLKKRIKSHLDASRRKDQTIYFSLSLRKYGIENFIFEQIDSAESVDELNDKEQKWIKDLNTLAPNGYNLTTGGNQGGSPSNSTRIRMSKKQKDRFKNTPHPFTGREHSEETREKISKSSLGKKRSPFTEQHRENMSKAQKGISKPHSKEWCKNQSRKMTGRKHSEESKQKRRDGRKCKKIFSPETGKIYDSIVKAAKEHGIFPGNIHKLMHKKINFLRDKKTGQKLTFRRIS